MKTRLLLFLLLLIGANTFAQYTTIPDVNFEKKLIALGIDDVADGKVLTSAISTLTTLDVSFSTIADLTGIQDFVSLTRLDCSSNKLTNINVTKNTALKRLDCGFNQISSLDVTQNLALTDLLCRNNQLTALDISKNTNLDYLLCNKNQLTALDVSNNIKLFQIWCNDNKIKTLDFSKNPLLKQVLCASNNLVSLNLKNGQNTLINTNDNGGVSFNFNPDLKCIQVDDPFYSNTNWADKKDFQAFYSPIDCSTVTQIPDANFEDKLIALSIDTDGKNGVVLNSSIATVTSLDVSNSSILDLEGIQGFLALTTLNCSGNLLKKIDLSKSTAFSTLDCSTNPDLICIQVADVAAAANWTTIKDAIANFNTDCTIYTLIPDTKFEEKLIILGIDTDGKNGKVATESISSLTFLNVNSSSITDLTGIQDFISLTQLTCYSNQLTNLDLSKNISLTYLDCRYNNLKSLDLSQNVNLENLYCYSNQLTALDLSQNTALINLQCYNNQLTTLNVSKSLSLKDLDCKYNLLTALDISKNAALTSLNCSSNKLRSLNLQNGENNLLTNSNVNLTGNPFLTCISVDNITYSNTNWADKKDPSAIFSPYECSTVTQIPDANFEDKLIALGIDTDGNNGIVLNTSIAAITSLDVSNSSISNLKGIEGFTALTSLNCSGNLLKKIDLSKNTALITLNCSNSPALICIQVADVDYAAANWATIKDAAASFSLDCTIYTLLPDSKFEDRLIALGIDQDGKNGKVATESIASLTYLNVAFSSITDLTGIQDFKSLTDLHCYDNQITTLDVSKNTALTYLGCGTNKLTSIDISKNTALTSFGCDFNKITALDVSANVNLTFISCRYNQLTSLDISKNVAVTSLNCSGNKLTSLNLKNGKNTLITNDKITLNYNPDLKCILVDDVAYADTNWSSKKDATANFNTDCTLYTLIPDSNFEDKLIALGIDTDGKNGKVITANVSSLTSLEIYNSNIANMSGIEDFVSLTNLDCSGNALTALDVSKNTALTYLNCSTNSITALDVSKNTGLTDLYCNANKLTILDVSNNLALNKLNCSENVLTTLDVSKNTTLTEINCYSNSLTSLNLKNGNNANMVRMYFSNLAQNPALKCIQVDNAAYCNNNWEAKDATAGYSSDCAALANTYTIIPDSNFEDKLIALGIDKDGKNNKVLTSSIFNVGTLDVSNSGITDLTGIEDFKMLTTLTCNNNTISALDISKNQSLDKLYCSSNKISNLDLTQNTALTVLSCSFNLLTTLDVSANKSLKQLECSNNSLTYLNIQNGNNTNMQSMFFGNFTENPKLTCILVDDASYSADNWGLAKDVIATYNTVCLPYTLIPDSNFEDKLITIGIDTDGKNGKVLTSSINTQIDLDVRSASISDLTGIEDFTALKILVCSDNLLSQIDLSKNTALITLFCEKNQLTDLDVSKNSNLDYLVCHTNQLTNLDVSSNLALTYLSCGLNQMTNLDVSKNTKLTSLYCSDGNLAKLNIKNGNNTNIITFIATKNPSLSCIQVDDAAYADSFEAPFFKDAAATYATDCSLLGIEETVFDKIAIYPNPTKGELHIDNVVLEKATVYDALGKLVKTSTFTSGANNNTIYLTGLPKGIYYVYLQSEGASTAKKIIVE